MTATMPQPGSDSSNTGRSGLVDWVRTMLRCPVGGHELIDATSPQGAPELHCAVDCGGPGRRRAYRVEDGIPVLLAEEARWIEAVPRH